MTLLDPWIHGPCSMYHVVTSMHKRELSRASRSGWIHLHPQESAPLRLGPSPLKKTRLCCNLPLALSSPLFSFIVESASLSIKH
jgi:hypothetical protein